MSTRGDADDAACFSSIAAALCDHLMDQSRGAIKGHHHRGTAADFTQDLRLSSRYLSRNHEFMFPQ